MSRFGEEGRRYLALLKITAAEQARGNNSLYVEIRHEGAARAVNHVLLENWIQDMIDLDIENARYDPVVAVLDEGVERGDSRHDIARMTVQAAIDAGIVQEGNGVLDRLFPLMPTNPIVQKITSIIQKERVNIGSGPLDTSRIDEEVLTVLSALRQVMSEPERTKSS